MDKHKVAFLDRDGVLNEKAPEGDYVKCWKEFCFLPKVADALFELRALGFLLVVVTNQRCVALGIVSEEELREIHGRMTDELSARGAKLDAIYYCPHGVFDGCDCRKPKTGMILSAIRAFREAGIEVDVAESIMIGDSETDILAGKAMGMRTAFIGGAHHDVDLYGDSLIHVVRRLPGFCYTRKGCGMKNESAGIPGSIS